MPLKSGKTSTQVHADIEQKHRKLGDEEFKAKLEMTRAFCDVAKGYVQIGSAALALPLLFRKLCWGRKEVPTAFWEHLPGNWLHHGHFFSSRLRLGCFISGCQCEGFGISITWATGRAKTCTSRDTGLHRDS